jgi:hypothetical protein
VGPWSAILRGGEDVDSVREKIEKTPQKQSMVIKVAETPKTAPRL